MTPENIPLPLDWEMMVPSLWETLWTDPWWRVRVLWQALRGEGDD